MAINWPKAVNKMKRIVHKTAYHIIGLILIVIGLAGLILPIIPGLVLLGIGIYFMSLASLRIWNKIESFKTKYPNIGVHIDNFDRMVSKVFKKAH